MKTGIIIFAHGSRDPQWQQPIQAVAKHIRQHHPELTVTCAYLELCSPTLAEAAANIIDSETTTVRILPMFFGIGKHAREDLPRLLEHLRQTHPAVYFKLLPAAGEQPQVIQLLAALAVESEERHP